MPQQAHNPNNYGRALLSALPQAIAPNSHTNLLNNLLNNLLYIQLYIQIANKTWFKKNWQIGEICI
jgi:hypothetical protein